MVRPEITIGRRRIKSGGDAFVIAEIGHNHQGSLETCLEMCRVAKDCGCDAVKLQKRTLDRCYTKAFLATPYNSEHAYGATYGEHRAALEFGTSEYRDIRAYCTEIDIAFLSTAFDEEAADFLACVGVDAIKIASGDLTNTPLIKHCAGLGQPLVISTGGWDMADVVRADRAVGMTPAAFLHCVARYPMPTEQANLSAIGELSIRLQHRIIGYSCHENGILAAEIAYGCWDAAIIEKHFTLDHTWKGSDQAMSLQPDGMRRLVRNLRRIHDMDGTGRKRRTREEDAALTKMAKILWPSKSLPAGHILQKGDLAAKSPVKPGGLLPYRLEDLTGRDLVFGCSTAEPLTATHVGEDDDGTI